MTPRIMKSCTGYPECQHTEPIPETLKLRLAGAPELPMFDEDYSDDD